MAATSNVIEHYRGDSLSVDFTCVNKRTKVAQPLDTSGTRVWATIKSDTDDTDAEALVQLEVGDNAITGTAQGGGAASITLAAGASAETDKYRSLKITITSGPGAGESKRITAYNGTTKLATVASAWSVQPTSSSTYSILIGTVTVLPSPNAHVARVDVEAGVLARFAPEDYAIDLQVMLPGPPERVYTAFRGTLRITSDVTRAAPY